MVVLSQRQEAIMLLMAQPDPSDLKPRLHAWRWRSPRDREAMKQDIVLRWMVRKEMESVRENYGR